jgi:hypothetical protein
MESPDDDILEPDLPIPPTLPRDILDATPNPPTSSTATISSMTDEELDDLVCRLKTHFRRAGIAMLDGMLRRLGHRVQRERIRASLIRVDPV